jgi:hypothetical protein
MVHLWYGQKRITIEELPDCPLMDAKNLGWILGLTPQRVRQLRKIGLPRVANGYYPLYGCIRFYIGYLKTCGFLRKRSKSKERYWNLKVKLLEVRLQQITGKFIEEELIEARRHLVRNLDRQLSGLATAMGREFGLSNKQTVGLRRRIHEARNAIVGENDEFICKRVPDWWPSQRR